VNRDAEYTEFRLDRDEEIRLLTPIANSHPDSPWTARVQEYINTLESG